MTTTTLPDLRELYAHMKGATFGGADEQEPLRTSKRNGLARKGLWDHEELVVRQYHHDTGPRSDRALLPHEEGAAAELRRLCAGEDPGALGGKDLDVLADLACKHENLRVPGLQGYAGRYVAVSASRHPGLSTTHLHQLLLVRGTTSQTVAGDYEMVRNLAAHPSFHHSLVVEVLMASLVPGDPGATDPLPKDPLTTMMVGLVIRRRPTLYGQGSGVLPWDLRRVLDLLVAAGPAAAEVFAVLKAQSGGWPTPGQLLELAEVAARSVL